LLTADNHLDPPALMYGPRRFDRKMDFLRCFEATVEYALKNKPDLFLVAGDLFDHTQPRNPTRTHVMESFRSLYEKGVKVFLIGGHHDTPRSREQGSSPLSIYGSSKYVSYFQDPSQIASTTFQIGGRSVMISGLSYNPAVPWDSDPLEGLKFAPQADVNILMLHYPIRGFRGYYGDEPAVQPNSIPEDLHLVAAGHLHGHQRSVIRGVNVVYPGSTERVRFLEEGEEKGFVWIELDKEGLVSLDFIKTPARELRTFEFRIPSKGNINEILKEELLKLQDSGLILRVKFKGSVDVKQLSTYRRSEIQSFAYDKFFNLLFDEGEMEIRRPEAIQPLPRTTPLEEIRHYFQVQLEKEDGEERSLLLEALEMCEQKLQEAGAW
ncbi:MAG: DNA repair exonuclease, partial [Candidatus Bathyarchaeia archaeon]